MVSHTFFMSNRITPIKSLKRWMKNNMLGDLFFCHNFWPKGQKYMLHKTKKKILVMRFICVC